MHCLFVWSYLYENYNGSHLKVNAEFVVIHMICKLIALLIVYNKFTDMNGSHGGGSIPRLNFFEKGSSLIFILVLNDTNELKISGSPVDMMGLNARQEKPCIRSPHFLLLNKSLFRTVQGLFNIKGLKQLSKAKMHY